MKTYCGLYIRGKKKRNSNYMISQSTNRVLCMQTQSNQCIANQTVILTLRLILYVHVMAMSVCTLFVVNRVSQNIYITPSSDLQTVKIGATVLNFQSGDRLDFHCILYQAECVVNLIIWFSVAPHAKSNWNEAEMDCVSRHR